MKIRTYKAFILNDDGTTSVYERPFVREGLPRDEALTLINRWNHEVMEGPKAYRINGQPRYMYWLQED